ncbi:MAG: hypothetical protein N4A37_03220 [Prolixibacteraceae bacterium]|jgi:polyhydroxyalkanoate synthesis regulator phasin|nr:hypothetical protein [Prolixibacteraceae bacterium]
MAEQQKLEADGKKVEKTLVIDLQDQYNAVIEDASAISNSIYKDQYRQAAKCTSEILFHGKQLKDSSKNICTKYKEQDFNNIIAFCGERGTGKTSTMLSYARLLENISNESNKEYDKPKSIYNYQLIDVVDPSLFEKNENLFEVVLAKMFAKTMEKLKNRHKNRHLEKEGKRKLLECYSSVYRDLGAIHQKDENRYKGDALETLSDLAGGSNLRNNFKELVDCYLKYHTSDSRGCNKDEVLVIPIDDFDLNTESASEMGEQIRKYLMIPNVVILMAVNMEQLTNVKEQSVRNKFKTLIDAGRLYEDPKEFAVNYLVKLIPYSRRIILYSDNVFVKNTSIEFKNWKHRKPKPNENIEEFILETIYDLTGLIFLPKEIGVHFLIPKTLRQLRGFIYFLNSLQPNGTDRQDKTILKDNFKLFKQYIYQQYIPDLLSKDERDLVESVIHADAFHQNKILIDGVYDLLEKRYRNRKGVNATNIETLFSNIDAKDCRDLLLRDIYDPNNFSENISLRDVRYVLTKLGNVTNDFDVTKLVDCLKVLLYLELYNTAAIEQNAMHLGKLCGESIVPYLDKKIIISQSMNLSQYSIFELDLDGTNCRFTTRDNETGEYLDKVNKLYQDLKPFVKYEYKVVEKYISGKLTENGSSGSATSFKEYLIEDHHERRKIKHSLSEIETLKNQDSGPYLLNPRIGFHLDIWQEYLKIDDLDNHVWKLSLDVIDCLFANIHQLNDRYELSIPSGVNDELKDIKQAIYPLIEKFTTNLLKNIQSQIGKISYRGVLPFNVEEITMVLKDISSISYVHNIDVKHKQQYSIEDMLMREKVVRDSEKRKAKVERLKYNRQIEELQEQFNKDREDNKNQIKNILLGSVFNQYSFQIKNLFEKSNENTVLLKLLEKSLIDEDIKVILINVIDDFIRSHKGMSNRSRVKTFKNKGFIKYYNDSLTSYLNTNRDTLFEDDNIKKRFQDLSSTNIDVEENEVLNFLSNTESNQ